MDKKSILAKLDQLERTLAKAQYEIVELREAIVGEHLTPSPLVNFLVKLEQSATLQGQWEHSPDDVIDHADLPPGDKTVLKQAVDAIDKQIHTEGASAASVAYVRIWVKPPGGGGGGG